MKFLIVSAVFLAGLYGALAFPILNQSKIVAKRSTREQTRRAEAHAAQVRSTLEAFRRGDPAREAEARATMAALPAYEGRRLDFAAALASRGEAQAAYALARPKARFGQYSLPNDGEMALYAQLAERAGHPEEATWARERTGEGGHFRVWMRGEHDTFAQKRGSSFPTGKWNYMIVVNLDMNRGLDLYPRFREEVEALRRELLAAP